MPGKGGAGWRGGFAFGRGVLVGGVTGPGEGGGAGL